jgi:lysophospholipase L1-like esterase
LAANADCIVVQAGINDFMRAIGGADDADDPHLQARPFCYRAQLLRTVYRLLRPPPVLDIEGRGGQEYTARRAQRSSAPIVDALPDLAPALQRYATQWRELRALCEARGTALVCTTQPVVWRDGLPEAALASLWMGRTATGAYLSVSALRAGMEAFDAATRASGVPCIDLTELNGRPELFYDDCHFNEAGAREVAARVAEGLLERAPWR